MKWLYKLLGIRTEPKKDWWEIEKEYELQQAPIRQKQEDDRWGRDIRYRVGKMLMERNYQLEMQKIKARMYPDSPTMQLWANSEPLIIADVGWKSYYTVHDRATAKYINGNTHEELMRVYKEMKLEYDQSINSIEKIN